jgi:hypothetical protein
VTARLTRREVKNIRNLFRKLDFSALAIRLGYRPTNQFSRMIKDKENLLRARIIERKARRKWVQRLFQQ